MRNKRKMGYVFLMSLLILCCSSTTVFAADTSAEYVPQLYATIWSLVPPVACNRTGTYYKGSLQLLIR